MLGRLAGPIGGLNWKIRNEEIHVGVLINYHVLFWKLCAVRYGLLYALNHALNLMQGVRNLFSRDCCCSPNEYWGVLGHVFGDIN